MTEDRGQRTEGRRKKSEVGNIRLGISEGGLRIEKSEYRCQRIERRIQIMTTEGHGETRKI
jgi:hypothetical protein